MNDDISKIQIALDSLNNPISVDEAIKNAFNNIEKNDKVTFLFNKISEEDKKEIVINLLSYSFINNTEFNKEVELFVRKKSPVLAQAKVETGMIIAKYANKAYISETPDNNLLVV
jgi:hypothetical protein